MNWSRFAIPLIILLLSGCLQSDEPPLPTPTPFTSTGSTIRAPVGEPIPISLANLAANPALFEGANLQLRGQYQPLPRLICEQEAFPSPATWGLVGEGLMANATGFDEQLRKLAVVGQELTVQGRWLRYQGPVGCGKSAREQEVWYLSTSRIVDPHPLARGGQVVPTVFPESTAVSELPATDTAAIIEETAVPTETPILGEQATATVPPTFVPSVTPESPFPATATAPPGLVMTLTPSPTMATLVPAGTGTSEPTGTGTPATATPTAGTETATPTPTATATSSSQGSINQGQPDFEDLIIGQLAAGTTDAWSVDVSTSTAVTITVAPELPADIVLTVLDGDGQTISTRDQATAGGVETIRDLDVSGIDSIQIQVSADPPREMDYALMVLDESSYSFVFQGTLDFGDQRTGTITEEMDHFWFFSATDGESIDLRVNPTGSADAYVELYGPDGVRIRTIDEEAAGAAEILNNHSILATGLYSVRVGEFDFGPMTYQILVDES